MKHNYLVCISAVELERLSSQHKAWLPETHGILIDSGFAKSKNIGVFGCGPGLTTYDIAKSISPQAIVTGIDVSDYYLNYLRQRVEKESIANISVLQHDLTKPTNLSAQFDATFCRWFLAWVAEDLKQVLTTIYDSLKPGGVFVAMEYLTLKSTVHSPQCKYLSKYLDAWERFYRDARGTTEIGSVLPQKFREIGFKISDMRCVGGHFPNNARLYNWWKRLFFEFKANFQEKKLLSEEEISEIEQFWLENETNPDSFIYSPVLLQIVGVKP